MPPATDRGEGPASYLAVVLLVGLLVGALVVANVPVSVTAGIKAAVCKVVSDSRCDTPEEAGGGSGAAGDGRRGVSAAPRDSGKKDDGNCWSWAHWACSAVDGLRLGTGDVLTDAWDGVTFVGCLAHICSHDGFKSNWSGIGALFTTDPRVTAKTMWDESTKPIRDDWNNGHKVRAVFRAVPTVLGTVFGGKGLTKLKHLKDKKPDPPPPRDPPDVIARRAGEAARRGDVDAADKALADAERHLRELREAAADDPARVSFGDMSKARAAVWEARRAAKDARIRKILLQTPSGRWANDILNRYNVEVVYRSRGGTEYFHDSNRVMMSTSRGGSTPEEELLPENALSPEEQAVDLVHEANHVEYDHTGRSAAISLPRDKFVDGLLREEAEGVARQVEMTYELRAHGARLDVTDMEDVYSRGYNRAVGQAERRGEALTDADRQRIGRKGAVDALEQAFRSGRFRTSSTNETYPEYYGKQWDRANGWSTP
ncbi:hypothetical protein ABZ801_37525 [Actinomadura sp. NPDC047616]|uniref:hypothetical protein n=1 Tax=Actinomadura sp. NPDC047616 TaxID=3155914 RepID=UPI0033EBF7F7